MRLDEFTADDLNRAIEIYLRIAYVDRDTRPVVPPFDPARPASEQLHRFVDESAGRTDGARLRRYTMRLGNARYPHMKLVLEEYLQAGDYYLLVDSHDALPGVRDEDQSLYLAITRRNRRTRVAIERAWDEAGLPTLHRLHEQLRESRRSGDSGRLVPVAGRTAGRSPTSGSLPAVQAQQDLDDLADDLAPPMILVVDDEADLGGCTAEILRRVGYQVTRAYDGRQAIVRSHVIPPDLIVCDIDMPDVDGRTACHRWRANATTAGIPIVVLTSSTISEAARPEANVVLQKPLDAATLVETVRRLLEAGRVSR
jgi:CheY-like chemotaxis protein